jgi:hypothetical protein
MSRTPQKICNGLPHTGGSPFLSEFSSAPYRTVPYRTVPQHTIYRSKKNRTI